MKDTPTTKINSVAPSRNNVAQEPALNPIAKMVEDTGSVMERWREKVRDKPHPQSKKTPECVEEIRVRLACGESLAQIAKDSHMPNYSTMKIWRMDDPDFKAITNAAYQEYAHTLREIHFDILSGELSLGSHQDNKNAADGIKWQAAKLNRVDFGEKVDVTMDTTRYTIIQADAVSSFLLAPPEIEDADYDEVSAIEAIEDGRDDEG